MHIVCCTDHNYIMPTGVMICSVCENNMDSRTTFHIILDSSVTKEDKQALEAIINKYGCISRYYTMDKINDCFFVSRQGQNSHIRSLVAYYRLFLGVLLPADIDRVLYLDGDIIVRGSLKGLFDIDLEGVSVAAVADAGQWDASRYQTLGYPSSYGYFNSGVLLINLKYWREHDLLNDFINFATSYPERLKCHDQDVLNFTLRDTKLSLPLKYNLQNGFLYNELVIDNSYCDELKEAIGNPVILHYTARVKPWFKYCEHPYKEEFFKYRSLTQWSKDKLISDNPNTRQRIRRLCYHLGLLKRLETKFINVKPL